MTKKVWKLTSYFKDDLENMVDKQVLAEYKQETLYLRNNSNRTR
jgi:hypothetical protein